MPKIVASKEDWINIGFKLFSRKGINGLVVEQMAKTLKCNKSSFYWHFKTKEGFFDELVKMWSYNDTQQIIDLADRAGDINERYHRFIGLVFQKDPYLDFIFYLKRYAQKKTQYQAIIDQIDEQRIHYLISMLEDMGMSKERAEVKSIILYRYLIGFHEMYRYKSMEPGYLDNVKRDIHMMLELPQSVDIKSIL